MIESTSTSEEQILSIVTIDQAVMENTNMFPAIWMKQVVFPGKDSEPFHSFWLQALDWRQYGLTNFHMCSQKKLF